MLCQALFGFPVLAELPVKMSVEGMAKTSSDCAEIKINEKPANYNWRVGCVHMDEFRRNMVQSKIIQ